MKNYKTRDDKQELLQQALEGTQRIEKALKDIMEKKESEQSACRKYDIKLNAFRHFLFNSSLGYRGPLVDDEDEVLFTGGERLYKDINPSVRTSNIPYDVDATFEYMFNNMDLFTEREVSVLKDHYWDCLTLEESAKKYNVTRERVRQMLGKSVRKLQHPTRHKMLIYGVNNYLASKELQKPNTDKVRDDFARELREKLEQISTERTYQAVTDVVEEGKKYLEKLDALGDFSNIKNKHSLLTKSVADLDLSVRSTNCLRRAGVQTVEELINIQYEDLLKVRNMGKTSLHEIIDKIHELGLKMKWED